MPLAESVNKSSRPVVESLKTSSEWITEVMSQAAKEVTAGWNLKAFILIRMGLHSWPKFPKEYFLIQIQKKMFQLFSIVLQRLSATYQAFSSGKNYVDAVLRARVRMRGGYSMTKMKKKRKNISLFKLKKKFEFFSLVLRPETKCHISRFFLWKKTKSMRSCARVYACARVIA